MEFLNKKQKILVYLIGMVMLLIIGYYVIKQTDNYQFNELETYENVIGNEQDIKSKENENEIIVHITGEIENEGIVVVEKDSRIADVIEEAGGVTEDADLSKINLAYQVKDGQKIYVPNIEDDLEEDYIIDDAGKGVLPEEETSEKVNINTAKQTELETLSGIGPSTALKIINYRNENGDFKEIEDLKNVPGIGESKFENIKNDICVWIKL